MAKLSSVNKNERRKKLVKKYAGKYERLKAVADGYYRKFGLCRVELRDLANKGMIPGVTKSSW